jgi:hypothetical protein
MSQPQVLEQVSGCGNVGSTHQNADTRGVAAGLRSSQIDKKRGSDRRKSGQEPPLKKNGRQAAALQTLQV